jgi:deoxyribose-phosphate aldolase
MGDNQDLHGTSSPRMGGMTAPVTRADLARIIDHTLLAPEATDAQVAALCEQGVRFGVAAVCVTAARVALAVKEAGDVPVAAVVGFPSGAHLSLIKATEAAAAAEAGARELDMVIDLGRAREGRWADVEADVAAVRSAVPAPLVLKVILETALLAPDGVVAACRAAVAAGADLVKTSTGFHPAGGATLEAVRLMAAEIAAASRPVGLKASGGIRTAEQALAYVAAGATRLGMSATGAVLAGLPD